MANYIAQATGDCGVQWKNHEASDKGLSEHSQG